MPNQAEVSAAAKPAAQLVVPAGTETLSAWVRASADGRPAYRAFRRLCMSTACRDSWQLFQQAVLIGLLTCCGAAD